MVGRINAYLFAILKEVLSTIQACVNHPMPSLSVGQTGEPDVLYIPMTVQDKKEVVSRTVNPFVPSIELIG